VNAQDRMGDGWATFETPLSTELQSFPQAAGSAAESQAKLVSPEIDGGFFRRAGEALGAIATLQDRPLTRVNLQSLGIPENEVRTIEEVQHIPDAASLGNIAEDIALKPSYLITLIACAIRNFEAPPGDGKLELL
jgi:hypothetical protein